MTAWRDLLGRSPGGTVYHDPELVLASESGDRTQVFSEENVPTGSLRSLAILAPKVVRARVFPGLPWSVKLRGYRLVGNAVLGADEASSTGEVVHNLVRRITGEYAACLYAEDVAVDSSLWQALARAGDGNAGRVYYPAQAQPHWWICFPDKAESYWDQFSKKARYNLRRSVKRLEHEVQRYQDPADVEELLEQASLVSRTSWQAKRIGPRVTPSPESVAFWKRVAGLGALRSYVLRHDGRPVAFALGVQWHGCFTYEEIGYDPRLADASPGSVLLCRILDDLIAHDTPRRFDFGFGDADYKRLFGNHQTRSGPVLVVPRRWLPQTAVRLDALNRGLSQGLRHGLRRLGILNLARKLYRK